MTGLKHLLDQKFAEYNQVGFIGNDPICIPHRFSLKQDIEISGFLAAILAWGQRKTIISKCDEFLQYMDNAPYDFVLNHKERDLKPFTNFCHRTFNTTDALYFLHFFRFHYAGHASLETAFTGQFSPGDDSVDKALIGFREYFFSLPDFPSRTQKHISSPISKSACKRLNMFLRWMVRKDEAKVDFGLWEQIKPHHLICPCDLHVDRVARRLGLITRRQTDWQAALELTNNLRKLDPVDPVKYDFALFGLGLEDRINSSRYPDWSSMPEV